MSGLLRGQPNSNAHAHGIRSALGTDTGIEVITDQARNMQAKAKVQRAVVGTSGRYHRFE